MMNELSLHKKGLTSIEVKPNIKLIKTEVLQHFISQLQALFCFHS